jgi:hypothetical protein
VEGAVPDGCPAGLDMLARVAPARGCDTSGALRAAQALEARSGELRDARDDA